jgi:hypothetical protein
VKASGQHLVDQNNTPFLMVGDGTAQGLAVMASTSTAATYFADRQSYGINAVWIHSLFGHSGAPRHQKHFNALTAS